MTDERLYLEATEEAQSSTRDKALWAKAMALTLGNENQAMYKYVELRVMQIAQTTTNSPVGSAVGNKRLDSSSAFPAPPRSTRSATQKHGRRFSPLDNSTSRGADTSSQIDIVLDQTMAYEPINVSSRPEQKTKKPILKDNQKFSPFDTRNKSKSSRSATDSQVADLSSKTTVPDSNNQKARKSNYGDDNQDSDRIQFTDVDIDKKIADSKATPVTSGKEDKLHPWRRNFSRFVDFWTVGMLFGLCVVYLISLGNVTEPLVMFLAMRLTWIFVEAGSLSMFGTTPAKWFFGIIVRDSRGKKLPFGVALLRTLHVWIVGEGLNIPIVSVIMRMIAYRTLTQNGITSWDEAYRCVITHKKWNWWRATICVGSFVVSLTTIALLYSFYRLPVEFF